MTLLACHECDLLQRLDPVPEGRVARCQRCGAVLVRRRRNSLERTLALTLAAAVLYAVANLFPFLNINVKGQISRTTLLTGVRSLHEQDLTLVAILVLLTAIVIPLIRITSSLYVLVPLRWNRVPPRAAQVFRLSGKLRPWAMMEIFMLGILVSVVKLSSMAAIIPGVALWSFAALIIVMAAAAANLDPDVVWERLETRQ